MDKVSYYNVESTTGDNMIIYNTLTDSLICLTKEEFMEIELLMDDLQTFCKEYPLLYQELKKAGFIIDEDFNELDYIKLRNKRRVFESKDYHITINPTLDCNIACWYCSTEYAKAIHEGAMTKEMTNSVIQHVEHVIVKQRAKSLHLDWFGGEPLLYFDEVIVPIATSANKLVKENNIRFTQHITTNATLMDLDRLHLMKELNFTSFQIPIDGNEERHNKIKFFNNKSGTYKTVIDNINNIAQIIPNAHIVLRINHDKQTLKHIRDIIKDISEESKTHIEVDFQRVWQVPFTEKDIALLKDTKEFFLQNGLKSNFWAYRPQIFIRCYADRLHHYAINYDGRVFKCTARDYGDDKVIGNLLPNGRIEWNDKLLSVFFAKSTFENERCIECCMLPVCMGPCIQKNYDSLINNTPLPCVIENAEYTLNSYIIEQAKKRNLINRLQ